MGRFVCHNQACRASGWSSKKIAVTIRLYPRQEYNARVYHQRCKFCGWISRPVLDQSYPERIVYWIRQWNGVRVERPPVSNNSGGPHNRELCEGCRAGHCPQLGEDWIAQLERFVSLKSVTLVKNRVDIFSDWLSNQPEFHVWSKRKSERRNFQVSDSPGGTTAKYEIQYYWFKSSRSFMLWYESLLLSWRLGGGTRIASKILSYDPFTLSCLFAEPYKEKPHLICVSSIGVFLMTSHLRSKPSLAMTGESQGQRRDRHESRWTARYVNNKDNAQIRT